MSTKLSVDVDMENKAICGWVVSGEIISTVDVYHHMNKVATGVCNLHRPDILALNMHSTGNCGFSFSETKHGFVRGNVYIVGVKAGSEYLRVLRVYGDSASLLNEFIGLELLPRNDPSHLDLETEGVVSSNSDVQAYKKLLIRLRRGSRGRSWRGEFVGTDYSHRETDFVYFKFLTESLLAFWLGFLDARYLWSVVDTYADYGMREEKLAALAVSNFMHAERMFQTRRCIFDSVEKALEDRIVDRQVEYWGGMKSNQLSGDDALDIFLSRNIEILQSAPVIRSIFFEILARAASAPDSSLGFNLANSSYFKEVFSHYEIIL